MMTKEEILKLAQTCGFDTFVGEKDNGTNSDYWECWEDQLLKFARIIHTEGFREGIDEGYEIGKSASYRNPMEGIYD